MIEIFIKDNSIFQSASKDHIHYSQVDQRDGKIILVEEKLTQNQLELAFMNQPYPLKCKP